MSLGDSSTELGKVRGLGSAREGGEHWIGERVSSIALLLLGVWLIASLLMLPALDHATVTSFYHGLDGLKVVVDDYVHEPGNNFALNTLLLFLAVGGAAFALFALAKVAFGGAA